MNPLIGLAAAGTIGISSAEIVAPEAVMKALMAPSEEVSPTTRTMVRAFGVRNLTLGAMMLSARGRAGLRSALPVFVAAELVAVGLALADEDTSPALPLLGGGATLSLAAILWRGFSDD